MKPSLQFLAHHAADAPAIDTETFRPAWRKHDHLRGLRDAEEITAYEYASALCFRQVAEHVIVAAWPPPLWLGSGGRRGGSHGAPLTRAGDVEMLGQVRAALGPFACGLLEACLIYDFTWDYLGARLGIDPRTARAWTILAIKGLARVPAAPLASTD